MDYRTKVNQLYDYIQFQEKKISKFEKLIEDLHTEIKTLKEKPPINVERIEYKFDQLKIERLDGTLNIGLNPSDLSNIEDMEISSPLQKGQQGQQAPPPFLNRPEFRANLCSRVRQYLSENMEGIIQDTETQLDMKLAPEYHEFIYHDLTGQIPQRIDHYINMVSGQNGGNLTEEQAGSQIFDQIRGDIQQAVFMFMSKLPKSMNGGNQNGS